MGAEKSKLSRQKQEGKERKLQVVNDYRRCYDEWKQNQNFIINLLSENEKFGRNLIKFFPNARNSYQDFLEMVYYMRKYDPHLQRNQAAKANIPHTTLLDRFFMVCLGLTSHSQLQTTNLNFEMKEQLFKEYMKLFIANPSGGFLKKLSEFMSADANQQMSLKEFSSIIRQYLPHAQKHLKDYYMNKFRDLEKDGHLLKHFDSKILKEDAVLLSMKVDSLAKKQIKMLYSSDTYGLSFHSIQKQIVGYTGHWLLLVEHFDKESGEKAIYKFGAYQSGPISDTNSFQGNLEGFLFSIQPNIRFMTTDKGDNGNFYFYINTMDEKLSKMRKGIGFGGNKYKQNFKLWIDQDLDKSKVHNGNDATYGFGKLASLGTQTLSIRKLQIWGLGSLHDLQNQEQYWKQRYEEIMKRRKVNKKQLIDGNAGLVFEKTFAHRDQVYGQIERNEKEEEK